jgi:FAD/FMN-containing dehydrogenase/ferredoxin
LAEQGLAPLTNPTSRFSTIGGWASTGGMGVDSFAHGHFREAILEARVILPSGEVQRLERGERGDELLDEMIGCEGQLGFFSELTLRVREKPTRSSPRLVTFDSPDKALAFVEELIEGEHRPSHVVFFDKAKMVEENLYALDRFGDGVALVDERDSVLLHFDDAEAEEHFLDTLGKDHGLEAKAHQTAARYLWADRFFPLKGQRLGPNLLASEVVLPRASLPGYVKAARRLASRFGSHLGVEVTFGRDGDEVVGVTIASYACDRTRKLDYMVRLVLTQLLTHLGMRSGGKPYGVGIWNTPFLPRKLSAETRARLRARKRELDPEGMLNPRKFFGLKTRFLGLPGLLFVPVIQDLGLWAMLLISPLLGLMARAMARPSPTSWAVPTPGEEKGRRLLAETSLRCTKCGSCVSTCPAYLITHDERVTGRAKLQLFEALEQRPDELVADEAHRPAQCLRCGLCEEVCQTRLPLRDCYDALEAQVEARFGPATELAEAFSQRLDQNRGWIATAFGLELPPWKPGEGALRVSGSHDKEDAA